MESGPDLAKYTGPGNNFTNYTLSGFGPSYSKVVIGADNKVWATASSGGAVGFDGTEWTTFPNIFTFISGVNGLGVSSTGVVWTSRSSHGLYHVQTAPTVQGTLYPFDSSVNLRKCGGSIVFYVVVNTKVVLSSAFFKNVQ